jgi:hypothetical protein
MKIHKGSEQNEQGMKRHFGKFYCFSNVADLAAVNMRYFITSNVSEQLCVLI